MPVWCTNISSEPSSGTMNPNPLAALNHFTCARRAAPRRPRRRQSIRDRRFASAPHAPPRALSETPTPSCAVGIFFSTRSRLARPSRTVPRARAIRPRPPMRESARARAIARSRVGVVRRRARRAVRTTDRPTAFFSVAVGSRARSVGRADGGRWDACMGVGVGVGGYFEG